MKQANETAVMARKNGGMTKTRRLVECALLVAVATVLSIFKLAELPYGGSVTMASMLPLVILAYRHGLLWGFGAGLSYGVIQQLLGLKNLSYFTSWQSIVAIIFLDYLLAFATPALVGFFRHVREQRVGMTSGALVACLTRYAFHVISGATVWAGLSIPTRAALGYSFIYNATYMVPETIVLVLAAWYLGSLIDFRKGMPTRLTEKEHQKISAYAVTAQLLILAALIVDTALVFAHLQDPETGTFTVTYLTAGKFVGSWRLTALVVTVVAVLAAVVLFLLRGIADREAAVAKETVDELAAEPTAEGQSQAESDDEPADEPPTDK